MDLINHLKKQMVEEGYLIPQFQLCLRTLYPVLKQKGKIKTIDVRPVSTRKHEGDFYGLLLDLGIPKDHHLAHLLINNLNSPGDYLGEVNTIEVIDGDTVEELYRIGEIKQGFI